jgi:hypothetical protein
MKNRLRFLLPNWLLLGTAFLIFSFVLSSCKNKQPPPPPSENNGFQIPLTGFSFLGTVVENAVKPYNNAVVRYTYKNSGGLVTPFPATTISSTTGKFGLSFSSILNPYTFFVIPNAGTNKVPIAYHMSNARSMKFLYDLQTISAATKPTLSINVLHNITELPLAGIQVTITNITAGSSPVVDTTDALGNTKMVEYKKGDALSITVSGNTGVTYTIETKSYFPANCAIKSVAFITP